MVLQLPFEAIKEKEKLRILDHKKSLDRKAMKD
jgi:hypothetical protein